MKRPLATLALAALLAAPAAVRADEVPHIEFVRALRASHLTEYALQYLEALRKDNPPPEVAALIPLEIAKTRLDRAADETDAGARLAEYEKARAEFLGFIAKNPANPLVGDARLQVARITVLQGKAQLSRALLQEDAGDRRKEELAARDTFVRANAELKAVADALGQQVEKFGEPKTAQERAEKRALEHARLQARMDLGLNFIDQAMTYEGNDAVLLARAEVLRKAQPILEDVAKDEAKGPLSWQAKAWAGYCDFQLGDEPKARAALKAVSTYPDPVAAAGKRLAGYFEITILLDPEKREDAARLAQARKSAEAWLAEYRGFVNTPEGCGVRYYLAEILTYQAVPMKDKAARAQLLKQARAYCRELSGFENDFGEKARVLGIKIVGAEGGFEKPIDALASFDECLLRARYEAGQVEEFARKKGVSADDVAKERKRRLANATESLTRALEIAKKPAAKVTPAEMGKARSMLAGYYLFAGKFQEAIDTGEPAATASPATAQTATAAMYVLEAYNDLINKKLADGTATLADLEKDGVTKKMLDLALMMEQRWPNEQAGDVGRHLRGLLLIRQKKPDEALDVLSKVSPGYPATIYVKSSLAATAFQAAQDRAAQAKAEPDKAKKEQLAKDEARYEALAVAALKALPPLPAGPDAVTSAVYLQSKIELGRAYYRAKQYAEIDKLVGPLLADLDKGVFKFEQPKQLDEAAASLKMLKLYARYGAAAAEFAAGHFAKVKEIADPVVTEIVKGAHPELKKNPSLRWGLMNLALRVSVQEGNVARAREVVQALQKFAGEEDGGGGSKAILMNLAQTIKDQVRDARQKKDDAQLKKMVENFGALLDDMYKGEKAPTPEYLRLMAEANAGLGRHDKAVELARQVTEPKGDDAKDDRKAANYHFCRLLVVRELRLDGSVKEAAKELEDVRKTAWGKDSSGATREFLHLLAVNSPYKAYQEWSKMVTALAAKIQMPGVKEQYFECYYFMTECWLRHARALKDDKKKEDGTKRAANFIVKLEAAWPDLGGEESKARFDDLLGREPALKEQYDKLKGGSK